MTVRLSIRGLSGGAEVHQELEVAIAAANRGFAGAEYRPSGGCCPLLEGFKDAPVDSGITDDAAAGDIGGAGFELWFEENDAGGAGLDAMLDGGEDLLKGDEGEVGDEEVDGGKFWKVAGVGAFKEGDAGVFAQFLMQLGAADVDGEDGGCAVLEEAIGEAAGGCAEVHAAEAGDIDGEGFECALEFLAAAGDVAFGLKEFKGGVWGEHGGGFDEDGGPGADAAGHDEALGAFTGVYEAAFDEEEVCALACHVRRVRE
jgi:hypothetical protein